MPPRRLILAIAAGAVAAQPVPALAVMNEGNPKGMAPARDGDIAIRQELEAARRADTVDAYDLFIARHPRHCLAEIARKERARLVDRRPPR